MATLPKDKLLEYLKHAIELESSIYTQQQIRKEYDASSDGRKPTLMLKGAPQAPIPSTANASMSSPVYSIVAILASLLGIFMAGAGILLITEMFFLALIVLVIGGAIAFPGILVVLEMITRKKRQRQLDKIYEKEYEAYERRKKSITEENEFTQKRYNENYREWQSSNNKVYSIMNRNLSDTQKTLSMLYAKDVIFSKYRNLPALTSIYEYLLSGRCDELTGPSGAYNLYEDELRKNIIIAQLNTIIANLEQIRRNQYTLYEEMRKIQRNTSAIANELYEIKGYTAELTALTALNTYYNGIIAGNSHILAYWR